LAILLFLLQPMCTSLHMTVMGHKPWVQAPQDTPLRTAS
jgi:hypothetical protein